MDFFDIRPPNRKVWQQHKMPGRNPALQKKKERAGQGPPLSDEWNLLSVELRRRRYRHVLGRILNGQPVGAHLVPFEQSQPIGSEKAPDARRVPAQNFFQHGHEDAHGVVAENGSLGDTRNELRFRDGDGQAVILVHVHHHGQVRTAVAHVDDLVVTDPEARPKFLQHGDLPPSGGRPNDGIHFAGSFVVAEARAKDVVRRNDALERRLDDLLRRGGDYVEMKLVAVSEIFERARKKRNVVLQADALTGIYKMLAAYPTKFRVVQDEVAEFRALLDEVHLRKALHLVVEAVKADKLAKNDSRVVEAERLVEVARQ